jgi:hypothetical protein
MVRVHSNPPYVSLIWGISSAGRAPALHAGGQRFDPAILHQIVRRDQRSLIQVLVNRVFELDF